MKSELLHLFARIKAEHPDAQNIVLSLNGVSTVTTRHGCVRFESLDALEQFTWPQLEATEPIPPTRGWPQPDNLQPLPRVTRVENL